MNFRDQSQHVIDKAQLAYRGQKSKSGVSNAQKTKHIQSIQPVSCLVSTTAMDQPICIFLHSYVPSDSVPVKTQLTTSQIVTQVKSSCAVRCAISSVGLAMLANTRNDPNLMTEARREYTTALRLTNSALRRENDCLKDTTLSAVLLLGMFEVRTRFSFVSLPPPLLLTMSFCNSKYLFQPVYMAIGDGLRSPQISGELAETHHRCCHTATIVEVKEGYDAHKYSAIYTSSHGCGMDVTDRIFLGHHTNWSCRWQTVCELKPMFPPWSDNCRHWSGLIDRKRTFTPKV